MGEEELIIAMMYIYNVCMLGLADPPFNALWRVIRLHRSNLIFWVLCNVARRIVRKKDYDEKDEGIVKEGPIPSFP